MQNLKIINTHIKKFFLKICKKEDLGYISKRTLSEFLKLQM